MLSHRSILFAAALTSAAVAALPVLGASLSTFDASTFASQGRDLAQVALVI